MKFVLGVILTAMAVFTWEALSWTALGWHESSWRQFRDERAMAEILAPSMSNSNTQASSGAGIYVMPAKPRPSKHATPEETKKQRQTMRKPARTAPSSMRWCVRDGER